jgi:hypothetical protein
VGSRKSRKLEQPLGGIPRPLGGKNRETPHPVGAHNVATVARCLGNLIIGVGVRVRSILLRYEEDNDDEACEDGLIKAYLGQSDDDSDSCTETSDSDSTSEDSDDDSCIEASGACMLEEEDGPCVVDRQLDG